MINWRCRMKQLMSLINGVFLGRSQSAKELGKKRKDKKRKDVSSGPAIFDQIEDVLCGCEHTSKNIRWQRGVDRE